MLDLSGFLVWRDCDSVAPLIPNASREQEILKVPTGRRSDCWPTKHLEKTRKWSLVSAADAAAVTHRRTICSCFQRQIFGMGRSSCTDLVICVLQLDLVL